jgi:AraC-like DNA-binding protein
MSIGPSCPVNGFDVIAVGAERVVYTRRSVRAAVLRPFVDSLELIEDVPLHGREHMVPTADTAMIFTFAEDGFVVFDPVETHASCATLVGPASAPQLVSTHARHGMLAVNFQPGGAVPFISGPVSDAADAFVPLVEHWAGEAARLRDRLLACPDGDRRFDLVERALITVMVEPVVDGGIRAAIAALERGDRVADVVDRYGTTAKPFIRRFTSAVGLTPKRYARVRRIQRVLHSLPDSGAVDWAALAVEHGFYDQSHLIHDFTLITGGSPAGHRARSTGGINHLVG